MTREGTDQRAAVGVLERRPRLGTLVSTASRSPGWRPGTMTDGLHSTFQAAVDHAHAEAALVLPAQPAAAEVDRGAEPGPGRGAVLGDPGHLEDQVTRVQLPVGAVQGVGDGLLAAGGQRGRGLVLPLLPGQQELLHGGLGRRRAALDQAEADDAEDHDDGSQLAERGSRRVVPPCFPRPVRSRYRSRTPPRPPWPPAPGFPAPAALAWAPCAGHDEWRRAHRGYACAASSATPLSPAPQSTVDLSGSVPLSQVMTLVVRALAPCQR